MAHSPAKLYRLRAHALAENCDVDSANMLEAAADAIEALGSIVQADDRAMAEMLEAGMDVYPETRELTELGRAALVKVQEAL